MNEQQWLDWIEENMKKADVHGPLGKYTADIVLATQLSNLISRLPEEKELPVIPQFVVNWIETCKGYKDNLFGVYEFAPEAVSFWIFENESKKERVDLIARAWLDGYTIQPEENMQVIFKLYDNVERKIFMPESEARKLIDKLEED